MDNGAIIESIELDRIIVDYSEDKEIVAIEILDAIKRTTTDSLYLIDLTKRFKQKTENLDAQIYWTLRRTPDLYFS
jgi:uncharacterized protein YuzE